jgi:hypothetical protein
MECLGKVALATILARLRRARQKENKRAVLGGSVGCKLPPYLLLFLLAAGKPKQSALAMQTNGC